MIWKKIKYYKLIPLIVLGIFLFLVKDILVDVMNKSEDFKDFKKFNRSFIYYGSLISWIYITFTSIRDKRYKLLTGRYYPKDHGTFKMNYFNLVNFFTNNDKYKMNVMNLPIEDWHNADGIILCKYRDLFGNYRLVKRNSNADGNLITFGLPGSGKSTTQAATSAVRFNAHRKNGGCGVFAISIKGDLLNFVRDKRPHIKVFTPDKAEGSCHYDPLEGLEKMNPTERRSRIETMSVIISPDEQGDNAAFFVTGARDYYCSITHYLLYLHDNGIIDGKLKFHEIVETILSSNVFEITETIRDSGCVIAGEYTNSYIGSSEKNVSGIYNHLCKAIRPFNNGALKELLDGEGECISPEDLSTGDVYIDVPQDKYHVYAPIMSIIISNFLMEFMRRADVSSKKKITPVLFLLDEVFQLNIPYPILSQAMSTLRSKKVSLFLLGQSIFQIKERYGDAQMHEIMDLCAYISLFNEQDPEGREYFQKLVGHRKMLKKSTSLSKGADNKQNSSGLNVSIEDEYIFDSEYFGNLTTWDKQQHRTVKRVLVYANGKYILGETTPCYE